MSAVQKIEQSSNAVASGQPVTESAAILAMVERAARDDTVNIDKMRELLAMRKEMLAEAAEQNFNNAMSQAQSEMRPIAADADNPQTKSRYASYFALDNAVRPIYTRHGFAVSYNTEDGAPPDHLRVVAYATCAGHTRKYRLDMPSDGKGAKGGDVMTKTHAAGAAITYGQRNLLKMIFNLAVGEDKDGNTANNSDPITEAQAKELRDLIDEVGADIQRFCAIFKIDGLALLPANKFGEAKNRLQKFGKNGGAK